MNSSIKSLLLILLTAFVSTHLKAQVTAGMLLSINKEIALAPEKRDITAKDSLTCEDMSVVGLEIDSAGVVRVEIAAAKKGTAFLSYPYVKSITDEQGIVIATGRIDSYGMFGGSRVVFELATTKDYKASIKKYHIQMVTLGNNWSCEMTYEKK